MSTHWEPQACKSLLGSGVSGGCLWGPKGAFGSPSSERLQGVRALRGHFLDTLERGLKGPRDSMLDTPLNTPIFRDTLLRGTLRAERARETPATGGGVPKASMHGGCLPERSSGKSAAPNRCCLLRFAPTCDMCSKSRKDCERQCPPRPKSNKHVATFKSNNKATQKVNRREFKRYLKRSFSVGERYLFIMMGS